jgi:DNA-binding CsgD family transcriptional regulator
MRTHKHLAALTQRNGELAESIEVIRHGVVIVATGARVVHLNSAAERILAAGDGLRMRAGRLTAVNLTADRELQRLVHGELTGDGVRGGSFTCARPSGRRPYVAHLIPLRPAGRPSRSPRAMVLLIDPELRNEPTAALLRRAYGLTATEAEVALLVMRGEGLNPIADALCISLTTVRTHLRRVFVKTDTHRQAELVRLLSTLTP